MTRTKLGWATGADGVRVQIGNLVRFRDNRKHPWTYAIYRGSENRATTFSDTPNGPITRWMHGSPRFIEAAIAVPVADREGDA